MFKKLLPLALLIMSCNSQSSSNSTAGNDSTSTIKAEPDITMAASQLIENTSKDENYGTSRVGKVIKLTNVVLGGTDELSKSDVQVWGNDGNIPAWNGNYLCCRYIFKLQNPEDKNLAVKGKLATITGTLAEYRDNSFTPPNASEQVVLKEYVFENVSLTISPDNPQTTSAPVEVNNVPSTETPAGTNTSSPGEDENGQLSGTITSEKAYFYEDKSLSTQRKAYLVKGDNVKYFAAKEGDFNMVFYTNSAGKTTSGWMLKENIK